MVLLASTYDQSQYFKAADLTQEKKLRIKAVTEEWIGVGADKEQKLVVWFTNDERGWCSIASTTARSAAPSVMPSKVGRARSSSCFQRWLNSAARWAPPAGAHPAAEASHRKRPIAAANSSC